MAKNMQSETYIEKMVNLLKNFDFFVPVQCIVVISNYHYMVINWE